MTKQELTTLLRSVGVNENTITAMENAYEMGVEQGRSEFVKNGDFEVSANGEVPLYVWQGDELKGEDKEGLWLGKEAEAKAMTLIADKQQELLAQKTDIEKQVTDKLTVLTETLALALTIYLAFPPKLPAIDVKALAKKAYTKTKKELQELRRTVSKENLKKGKEAFKYPMKPKELPTLPKPPEIPKLQIPKL